MHLVSLLKKEKDRGGFPGKKGTENETHAIFTFLLGRKNEEEKKEL